MANLVSWFDDPFKKKREQNQVQTNNSNPFQQVGNWLSKGGFVGDIARNVFGQNQNQNQVRTITANNLNTVNRNQGINRLNPGLRTFSNNNFGSTNTLNKLNTLNSSQERQKSAPNFTSQDSIGGDNATKEQNGPKLTTINNSSNNLTTLKSALGTNNSLQNFEQKMAQQRQEKQNEANQKQQLLNQRAEQAKSFYDNGFKTMGEKNTQAINATKDAYKNMFGQSATDRAASYQTKMFDKMNNPDGTVPQSSTDFVNKYRSLSSDDKWDVYQNIQKAKNTLTQAVTKADDEGRTDLKNAYGTLLSQMNMYDDMIADVDKGEKSFGKSLGDWLSSGGFVGNLAEPVTNAMGNISGNQETSRAISQDRAATKEGNNKLFDAVDFVGETTANIAANALTGGAYGLASSGMNLGDAIQSAVNDRNRQYYTDYEGNLTREDQSIGSKLAGVGNAALGLGMTAAGMKGFGPNIKFNNAGQTLQSAISNGQWGDLAKTMGKYAAKEIPFAVGQTALQQGISAAGGDQQFGENFGQQLAGNIVGDLAVDLTGALRQGRGGSRDLFEPSRQNEQSALQRIDNLGNKAPIGMTIRTTSNESSDSNSGSALQKIAQLGQRLVGNRLQPAFAGSNGQGLDGANPTVGKIDTTRNYSTYQGENGKIAVKIDDPTLLENVPVKKYESTIRKAILDKFRGNRLQIGQSDDEALVSNKTAGKISRRGGAVNDDIAYRNKGEASQQLDELVNNLHNIRTEPNNSNNPKKQNLESVTKGEIEVDVNGKKLYPTVVIRNYTDGTSVVHEISDIKRTAIGSTEPVRLDQLRKNGNSESPNDIVARNSKNVNIPVLDNVNPTGTVFTEYNPISRTGQISDNLVPYSKTAQIKPTDEVTVYRGVPKGTQKVLNAGDFITTNKQLAQDYAGDGDVISQKVPAGAILDDSTEPLGEEYIYRPDLLDTSNIKPQISPDNRSALERIADFGDKHGAGLSIKMVGDSQKDSTNGSAVSRLLGLRQQTSDNPTQQYVREQVAAQKQQSKTPLKEKVAASIDNLKHYLVDDAVAYQRYVKDKGERQIIDNGVDRVRASDTIAKQMIEDSGLAETIGKMKTEDADEFQQYLIAKRGQELKRQKGADFKTGRDDAADIALINAVGDKYAAQEKVVRDFNKMMLDYSVETGLISKGLRDQLVKDNTDYVPMNRIMDDIEGMGMHKSKQLANLSKQTAVQKIKGSDRVVQNPLESMIKNAVRVVNEGERNKTAKYLADTAAFREARMPEGAKARPGYDTLSFLQDGKQVKYEVPELVAKEMKNLNSVMGDNAQKIVNILSTPARFLRAGATGDNPMFAASNLIRDQLQTVVTGNLKANIKGTPKAIVAAFAPGQKGRALRAELARAGVTGTEYRQTYGYKPGELVKELQAGHQMPKQAWERLKHPIDTIADVIGRTEYFTRAQQYFGTNGTPEQKALAARNNTLNFGRGGSAVRVLNKMIPFLNAGVQGGRITVKQLKERPIRTTGAIAATIGIAAAARAMNNSINQDLYDRLGDEEKKNNLVFFTEDAKYDPETNRVTGVVKVPMPQMLYPVLDAVNNIDGKPEDLMTMAGDIFTAISGIEAPDTQANNIGESFLPVVNQLTPTAIKPFLETAMNKNTYTGQEIVSEYDANKNPEDKGAKYTTDAARKLAKITGVDAPVIDNFINNWGGGVAKDLVKVLGDNPDNKKDSGGIGRIFDEGAFRRFASGSVESQYEIAEGIAKNYKNEVKNNDTFKNLSANDQEKVLNAIDTDMNKIASVSAKVEQNRGNEIGDNGLSKRQTEIMSNGFNASNYVSAVLDKKQLYSGNGDNGNGGSDFSTLSGNALDYGKANTARSSAININDSIGNDYKDTLNAYNLMSSEDWEKYTYQPVNKDAEYKLALAKFENDSANGDLTDVDKVKRQKELRKLEVSQKWDKSTRDAYGLAGNKADMQNFLDNIENRDDMVGYLNALNRAMYDAGVITASTYKTRNRNINNLSSSSGGSSGKKKSGSTGLSNAAKSALSAYTKALTSGNSVKIKKASSAPSTSRKMASTSFKSTNLKKYTPRNPTITVKKGIK